MIAAWMASKLASVQISITATKPSEPNPMAAAAHISGRRAPRGRGDLANGKADQAQPQRLLQDHAGNRAIAGADQFQHGDFADLADGHGVDDEGDDRGADDRQDDQEHPDLPRRVGDQLVDQDLFHLRAGIDRQALPAPDRGGDGHRDRHPA
ncbi:MAG: hypothetical protein LKM31_11510 [Sphingobium sp.]|nr:hypothetical protein [Sphingobium sp.]